MSVPDNEQELLKEGVHVWNILMVEDNPTNRELLHEILVDYAFCDEAVNGREGFKKYNEDFYGEKKYQVILLDVAMPEVDGIALLKLVRENEAFYNVSKEDQLPIILVTAHKDRLSEAVELGCKEHVLKPIDPDVLIDTIKKVVGQ